MFTLKATFSTPSILKDRLHRKYAGSHEASDAETSGDDSGLEQTRSNSEPIDASPEEEQPQDAASNTDIQKDDEKVCSDSPETKHHWGSAFGAMKDRANSARCVMKDKASKQFGKYQPKLHRVKSTASMAANKGREAATKGREKFQPALSKGTIGWTRFKTRLASAGHVMADYMGDTPIDNIHLLDEHPWIYNCRFLEQYKTCNDEHNDHNAATRCFMNTYIIGNILLFCGDVQMLARCSAVNRTCHKLISNEKKMWKFCVRYGQLSNTLRPRFWEHVAGTNRMRETSEIDFLTYAEMARSKGDFTDTISKDVKRTYGSVAPHKRLEGEEVAKDVNEELIDQLSLILHALSSRFPDVGYCQGMDYIAAFVLDHIRMTGNNASDRTAADKSQVERAFWMLVCLFESHGLRQIFLPGLEKLNLQCLQLQKIMDITMPELAQHFDKNKIITEMYMVGWSQTFFLYVNALPRDTLNRIWDIFVWEKNSKIILRASLALLQIAQPFIQDKETDEIMKFLSTFGTDSQIILAESIVLEKALAAKITTTVLGKLQRQCEKPKRITDRRMNLNILHR